MTTFEFTNKGVDRHYDKPEDSDASVNTQFEAIKLEEDQVSKNKLFAQNEIDNTNLDCVVSAILINGSNDKISLINNKLKVLLDSGASSSIIYKNRLPEVIATTKHKQTPTVWRTNTGTFTTNKQATLTFMLAEYSAQRVVTWDVNVDEQLQNHTEYDMILGRDFLCSLGFVLDFQKRKVKWNGISVPMRSHTKPRTFARKEVSKIRPRTFVRKNRKTHNNKKLI